MHVCTIVSGHTLSTTSGSPFSPSQTRKEHVPYAAVLQVDQDAHPAVLKCLSSASWVWSADLIFGQVLILMCGSEYREVVAGPVAALTHIGAVVPLAVGARSR
jgi:hypothetical protein